MNRELGKDPRWLRYSFLFVPLLSGFLYFYGEIVTPTDAGIYASIVIFGLTALLSLVRLHLGIAVTLCLAILVPEYPREILDVFEALTVEKSISYNSTGSVYLGPFTLIAWLFLLNSMLVLYQAADLKISRYKMLIIVGFTTIGLSAMIYDVLIGNRPIAYAPIVTSAKFPIYLFLGLVQGIYLREKGSHDLIVSSMLILPLIIGFRALLFVAGDYFLETPKLDLLTRPLLSLAVLLFLIKKGGHPLYKRTISRVILYASLFTASRGEMIIILLATAAYILWTWRSHKLFKGRIISELLICGFIVVLAIQQASPRLYSFIVWKASELQVFGRQEVSGSGKVRVYELKNIIAGMLEDPIVAVFGKGFGGTFDYKTHPLPITEELDVKSYSDDQREAGRYHDVHTFWAAMLLKYGCAGLILYLFIPLLVISKSKSELFWKADYALLSGILAIVLIYNYYWKIEYMVFMGMLLGISQGPPLKHSSHTEGDLQIARRSH